MNYIFVKQRRAYIVTNVLPGESDAEAASRNSGQVAPVDEVLQWIELIGQKGLSLPTIPEDLLQYGDKDAAAAMRARYRLGVDRNIELRIDTEPLVAEIRNWLNTQPLSQPAVDYFMEKLK